MNQLPSLEDDKREKRLSKLRPEVVKLLDCPVCFERITPPVTVCQNGHAVCKTCLTKLQSCPICKTDFLANKNTILDQIIEENIFACKYVQNGCKVEMKLRDIEEHERKQCIYRTIMCMIVSAKGDPCHCEVPICQYYNHVNTSHRSSAEIIEFSLETKRTIDVGSDIRKVQILKDLKTSKIVFEIVRVHTEMKRFYVTYIFIGTNEETNKNGYELRLSNPKEKYKELKYKSLCVPLGVTEAEMEESERCLSLNMSILPNFTTNHQLTYSVKFETVAKKWYKKVGRRWTYGLTDDENAGSEGCCQKFFSISCLMKWYLFNKN